MERGLWVVHQGPAPSGHSFIPLATAQFKRTGEYWRGGRNALIGVCNMEFIGDLDGTGLLEDGTGLLEAVPGRLGGISYMKVRGKKHWALLFRVGSVAGAASGGASSTEAWAPPQTRCIPCAFEQGSLAVCLRGSGPDNQAYRELVSLPRGTDGDHRGVFRMQVKQNVSVCCWRGPRRE